MPDENAIAAAAQTWAGVFIDLEQSGAPSLERLGELTSDNVRFCDPFNDLTGRDALHALLEHTVEQVQQPHFELLDTAMSGSSAYLKWNMTGRIAVIGDWQVTGLSELYFTPDLLLAAHIDYWDAAAQFYARLPLLGRVLRLIAARAGPKTR